METVQLAIRDTRYASALQELLERNGEVQVQRVESPDPSQGGVVVVDADSLGRLAASAVNPERVVLITRNDPHYLTQAWNVGIRSVVFSEDPLSTAVLAIMAAELRTAKAEPAEAVAHPHENGDRLGCPLAESPASPSFQQRGKGESQE